MYRYLTLVLVIALSAFLPAQDKQANLQVKKGGTLNVEVLSADISINTWGKDEFVIRYNEDSRIRIEKKGNDIFVTNSDGDLDNISVYIPENFNFDINTAGGDIRMHSNIKGDVKLNTSGGDISLENITGTLVVSTGGGNVSINNVMGRAELKSYGGDMAFGKIAGSLKLSTAGGNISGGSVIGSCSISTAGGDISVGDFDGITEILSGGGNISAGKSKNKLLVKTGGGDIYIESILNEGIINSGSGNITIDYLSGSVKAKTNAGDIQIGIHPDYKGNTELMTSSGSVRLKVNEKANVKISAKVAHQGGFPENLSDYIHSDFKGPNTTSKTPGFFEATYEINKPEGTIQLKLSNGELYIKKAK
jgi:hypothetical protein